MQKNGFTLMELLAVIVILGIIGSITSVAVGKIRKKQSLNNYENMILGVLSGAKQYNIDHPNENKISVNILLDKRYTNIDTKITNLKNATVSFDYCNTQYLKKAYYITIDDKTYNDCGCVLNSDSNTDSYKLCEGKTSVNKATVIK